MLAVESMKNRLLKILERDLTPYGNIARDIDSFSTSGETVGQPRNGEK
jgi:hypothetical protein